MPQFNAYEQGDTVAPDYNAEFDGIVRESYSEAELHQFGSAGLKPFAPGELDAAKTLVLYGCLPIDSDSDHDGSGGHNAI